MLTARRDPLLHPGAPDAALPAHHSSHAAHPGHAHSPGFTRFMTVLQVVGSIVGIPLGLVSGYSIYHSNFSQEARCDGLRANIVSMLDRSADATTLRILVRRDVANFERSCGAVDPDAVAAFKTLLASSRHAARAPQPARQAAPARPVKEAAKPAAKKITPAELEHPRRDAARADANWVASVRAALLHVPAEKIESARAPAAVPAEPRRPASAEALRAAPAPALRLAPPPAAPRQVAPVPPPAASVAAAPAATADHPVPPASIPIAPPPAVAAAPAPEPERAGLRGTLAQIPLLGQMFGK